MSSRLSSSSQFKYYTRRMKMYILGVNGHPKTSMTPEDGGSPDKSTSLVAQSRSSRVKIKMSNTQFFARVLCWPSLGHLGAANGLGPSLGNAESSPSHIVQCPESGLLSVPSSAVLLAPVPVPAPTAAMATPDPDCSSTTNRIAMHRYVSRRHCTARAPGR